MTTDQFNLFDGDGGMARHSDPSTSKAAAATVNTNRLFSLIGDALRVYGPMTTEEIAERCQEHLQSITPRMVQMEKKGMVARTDHKRPGATGRRRIVWMAL